MSPKPAHMQKPKPKRALWEGEFIGEPKSVCATKMKRLGRVKIDDDHFAQRPRKVFDSWLGRVMARDGQTTYLLRKTQEQKAPEKFFKRASKRATIYRRAGQLATITQLDVKRANPDNPRLNVSYPEAYTSFLKLLVKNGVPEGEHAAAWEQVLKDHGGRMKK